MNGPVVTTVLVVKMATRLLILDERAAINWAITVNKKRLFGNFLKN